MYLNKYFIGTSGKGPFQCGASDKALLAKSKAIQNARICIDKDKYDTDEYNKKVFYYAAKEILSSKIDKKVAVCLVISISKDCLVDKDFAIKATIEIATDCGYDCKKVKKWVDNAVDELFRPRKDDKCYDDRKRCNKDCDCDRKCRKCDHEDCGCDDKDRDCDYKRRNRKDCDDDDKDK